MSDTYLLFNNVSFGYDQSIENLFENVTAHFDSGWSGVVGANGSGKSTLLRLADGTLLPNGGTIQSSGEVVYCPQRTDDPPQHAEWFMTAFDRISMKLIGLLEIEDDWLTRWNTLSHGERKRLQIAVALWREPDVLLLDEPTNHLDTNSTELLLSSLKDFRGTGLLVSHNRFLLDELCHQCVFLDSHSVVVRSGNYTQGKETEMLEYEASMKQRHEAEHALQKIKHEVARRRNTADKADRKRSKRRLGVRDHDAKAKIDLARVSGKDGAAGRRLRQLQGRVSQAEQRLEENGVQARRVTGIQLPTEASTRDRLFELKSQVLDLGNGMSLKIPDLDMQPLDKVALVGRNGRGKSTLVHRILDTLSIEKTDVCYIPQEVDRNVSEQILADVRSLSRARLGQMFTIVSRLGSEPKHLLETTIPSPGEVRKLLLAYGILQVPKLIVMDEPTNHMDLPSIECVEEALKDCHCGLLLVSHDMCFLRAVTDITWKIETPLERGGTYSLKK